MKKTRRSAAEPRALGKANAKRICEANPDYFTSAFNKKDQAPRSGAGGFG
ncbi:MAG: hypothetical protein ACO1OO_00980 [Flavisolibacter sp.]